MNPTPFHSFSPTATAAVILTTSAVATTLTTLTAITTALTNNVPV